MRVDHRGGRQQGHQDPMCSGETIVLTLRRLARQGLPGNPFRVHRLAQLHLAPQLTNPGLEYFNAIGRHDDRQMESAVDRLRDQLWLLVVLAHDV